MATVTRWFPMAMALPLALAAAWPGRAGATAREILGGHEGWLDRMGGGIRELGMGNTGTADEAAMPAAYWNPALLAFQRQLVAGAGAELRSLDRNGGYFGLQGRAAGNMGLGLAILNRGDLKVPAYDQDENYLGYAQPQALGTYFGLGVKTSRNNALGASVLWYHNNMDLGGTGDANTIGIVDLGWYRRWSFGLRSALSIRNLGIDPSLSSRYDLTTLGADEGPTGFSSTGRDFFPKTLVAALAYDHDWLGYHWDWTGEVLDYQLKDRLLVVDGNFHHWDFRLGAEWDLTAAAALRAGYDQGNLSLGAGYDYPLPHGKIRFDYAILLEAGWLTVNPYAVGLRYAF